MGKPAAVTWQDRTGHGRAAQGRARQSRAEQEQEWGRAAAAVPVGQRQGSAGRMAFGNLRILGNYYG